MAGTKNSGNRTQRVFREVNGFVRFPGGPRALTVLHDPDTFVAIVGFARRENVSVSDAVRTLVEWGIQADDEQTGGL